MSPLGVSTDTTGPGYANVPFVKFTLTRCPGRAVENQQANLPRRSKPDGARAANRRATGESDLCRRVARGRSEEIRRAYSLSHRSSHRDVTQCRSCRDCRRNACWRGRGSGRESDVEPSFVIRCDVKFVPVMFTGVPAAPTVGVKAVIVGVPAPDATVNELLLVAVPLGAVTLIGPVVAPLGTVATS
jgi:hypothetical protein